VPDWFQRVLDQGAIIRNAPIPFITVVVAIGAIEWFFLDTIYGTRIANRDAEIALLTRQRDDYRDKLGGATPDQAKAKIEALERTVNSVIGFKWDSLSKDEIDQLASNLSEIQPKFVNILYENQLGKDLAETILEAFKKAKWPEAFVSHGAGIGVGIQVGYGGGVALKIKNALETLTKLRPLLLHPEKQDQPGSTYILSIGVNQNQLFILTRPSFVIAGRRPGNPFCLAALPSLPHGCAGQARA
jgi:hypothetical protein